MNSEVRRFWEQAGIDPEEAERFIEKSLREQGLRLPRWYDKVLTLEFAGKFVLIVWLVIAAQIAAFLIIWVLERGVAAV